jgi:hypothetical protein
MRNLAWLLVLSGACAASATDNDLEGGKSDGDYNVAWDASIPNIVPERVHDYLERYQWGDYHIVFHMSRKWFLLGDPGRDWLTSVGEYGADLQEGDPGNGIEFLAMHRAMIEHLTERWGAEPVANDPDGRVTFVEVLAGWRTDEEARRGLASAGGDVARFERGLGMVHDANAFSEDDFGRFLQTTLRLSGEVDPDDSARRFYDHDEREGAGVHNWLHGQLADRQSPIDVGNPQTNLSNILFWRIHGWIDATWQAFERVHVRTADEQEAVDRQLARFRLHVQLHSDFADHHHPMPRPPDGVIDDVRPVMFADRVDCARLTAGTQTADCN